MVMSDMVKGAKNALKVVLDAHAGDRVLIVTDRQKEDIGKAFEGGAKELGAYVTMYLLPEEERPLKEIPDELRKLVVSNHIIINAFSGLGDETPFRIKLLKIETASKARVGHAPGISKEMMTDGPMNADYSEVSKNVDKVMDLFKDAEWVKITTDKGTDILLYIEGRAFATDVNIKPGTFGNLPAGEVWCAPVEDAANGVIIVDGSIGDIGQVPKPLRIEVKNGRIVKLECEDNALVKRVNELQEIDDEAKVIGELGIGLNPRARITGLLLEDEKAGRTAHIAFGNNEDMDGGENKSKTHRDFLFHRPTMVVTYKNGSKVTIIKDGIVL